jgi:hypothetical protein
LLFFELSLGGLKPPPEYIARPEQSGGKITFRTEYKEGERKRAKTTRKKREEEIHQSRTGCK